MRKLFLKSGTKKLLAALLYIYGIITLPIISISLALPENITLFTGSDSAQVSAVSSCTSNVCGNHTLSAKLFGIIPIKDVNVEILPETAVIPGGDVFGVKFFTKGVIVIGCTEIETENGFETPSEKADIKKNDIINKINGNEVNSIEDLSFIISNSFGKPLTVEYTREGQEKTTTLIPVKSKADGKYKSGLWVRDSTAGIGTLTYYMPYTKEFAGLGHGICDVDTGEIMPLLSGSIVDVKITDIVKGKPGEPGELKGSFSSIKKGEVYSNTSFGVFGKMYQNPTQQSTPIEVASRDKVKEGDGIILVNADGNGVKEYTVNLSKIDRYSDGTKCFVIEVTDSKLISLTGGIVQGMSGSPIIQNGKLIGAVTHVFVNNPTKGYGIFIENMLSEAEKTKW